MWKSEGVLIKKSRMAQVVLALFLFLTIWWLLLNPLTPANELNENQRYIWGASYQLIAIIGGIWGLTISRSWGGFKSLLGKTIIAFSIGLLCQALGQSIYSFYNLVLQVEAPYPSFGDIGFFGSILCYIYGTILLARVSAVSISLRAFINKIQAIVIPLVLLLVSYFVFLKAYEFDWSKPLQIFLDFGYPFGQAVYVSIAILIYLFVRNRLGGLMRGPITFLLIALVVQYLSDFNFLFQFSRDNWYVGGIGDYLYALSYFLMTLVLIQLGTTLQKIDKS